MPVIRDIQNAGAALKFFERHKLQLNLLHMSALWHTLKDTLRSRHDRTAWVRSAQEPLVSLLVYTTQLLGGDGLRPLYDGPASLKTVSAIANATAWVYKGAESSPDALHSLFARVVGETVRSLVMAL